MGQTKKNAQLTKNLTKNLYNLKMDGTFCDVQLHLQGSVICVHACILASASSFFMELLQSSNYLNSNSENHWCIRRPLQINLDEALSNVEDLCLICVTKIIDFLYLKELVILQGHLDHFRKISQHLKVIDLLSLFENHIAEKKVVDKITIEPSSDDPICKRSLSTSAKDNYFDNKSSQNDFIQKSDKLDDPSEIINNQSSVNNAMNNASNGSRCNQNLEKACELQCCNNNILNSSQKLNKNNKRLLICQVCNFSTVSINKMLIHLESSNHFGSFCPICLYEVKTETDLKEHAKEHANSQPFFCSVCSKRNKFFEHHKNHLKVHCRRKKFFCEICQKGFKRHQNLTAHLTTHGKQYMCRECDYITSELNLLENHLLRHNENNSRQESNDDTLIEARINTKVLLKKKFNCNVCDEGFTQKKNLTRHVRLKHLSESTYNCPLCDYVSNRTDLFRRHMQKHHNYIPDKKRERLEIQIKKHNVNKGSEEVLSPPTSNLSIVVPIQLVTQNDACSSNSVTKNSKSILNYTTLRIPGEQKTSEYNVDEIDAFKTDRNIILDSNNIGMVKNNKHSSSKKNYTATPKSVGFSNNETNAEQHPIVCKSNTDQFEDRLNSDLESLSSRALNVRESFDKKSSEGNNLFQVIDGDEKSAIKNNESTILGRNERFWLNESTGELINENQLINVQLIGSENAENSSLSLGDHISKFIFNDRSSGIPIFELGDDMEDQQASNPQTPQASVVELDDQDFLFSWNNMDNSFCSTWILNEATGELNMVSFNIQSLNTEMKLGGTDEASLEDDETALFLNEGTGDLSVIYFNPNKSEYNVECSINDQSVQNAMETLSEHSNDEFDDLLNEEFLMASANFMAHEENETFLNELTGELNITNLNHCQSQIQEQEVTVTGSESIYLNEETGEISWNALDKNVKNDLFTKSELLSFDFEDSLNCDDFEQFSTELSDISSQFCLDTNSTNDWHMVDESADTMLNEFTGELIKKI